MTDNSLKPVATLAEVASMRRSSWATFAQCPHRWMLETLGKVPAQDSKALRIGTAVHTVVERFIQGETMTASRDLLDEVGMPKEERESLWLYLKHQIQPLIPKLIGVEMRRLLTIKPGLPPLSVGLDLLAVLDDETLLIVDHKTDRHPRSLEEWRGDIQPLCYAYGARRMFTRQTGGAWPKQVRYRIGYVNLRTSVEWETDPAADAWLEQAYRETWEEIRAYMRRGHWPALFGEHCSFCPAQGQCPTFQDEMRRAEAGLTAIIHPERIVPAVPVHDAAEALLWLRAVIKAAESAKEKIEAGLKEELARVGSIQTRGQTLTLVGGSRREADAGSLIDGLIDWAMAHPTEVAPLHKHWGDLFTAKVGVLDKLLKECPALEEVVARHIQHREIAPSIKVMAAPKRGLTEAPVSGMLEVAGN